MNARPERPFVYLASRSPRRRALLRQIGVGCRRVPTAVDEMPREDEEPAGYASRLALEKARDAASRIPPDSAAPILAADTVVVAAGQLLGKPRDEADAARMLRLLSGRAHEVVSAVCVISALGETGAISRTQVVFRAVGAAEIAAYWRSGEPVDKAGGYAIQGIGSVFIREIHGSYSGVMGLPIFETARLLAGHGMAVLGERGDRS